MENRLIQVILGVMGLLFVGILVLLFFALRPEPEIRYASDGDLSGAGPAIDSGARIEIELLRSEIEALGTQIQQMQTTIRALEARPIAAPAPIQQGGNGGQNQAVAGAFAGDGTNELLNAYAETVLIGARRSLNKNVKHASPSYLTGVFGPPRQTLTNNCTQMTNSRLRAKLKTESVGPIRVTMVQPAIESMRRVFEQVKAVDPDLYARISTAGSLCVRHIRGAPGRASSHAFGLSVDLNIDGKLDALGDGKTQLGLTILADFFQAEGWYWGAGFGREDSMHFEASRDLVEKWIAEGKL